MTPDDVVYSKKESPDRAMDFVIASLRRDFGGSSFQDGYIMAVRVEHFILQSVLRG